MAEEGKQRRHNMSSVFMAAKRAGLQVTGAVVRVDGIELKFAQGGGAAEQPSENPWEKQYGQAAEVR